MSQENVDALRRSNKAFNDGELDRALELWDPEAVYHEQPGTPLDTPEVLHGLDQIHASLTSYLAEFPDFHSKIEELVDGGDKVICVQRWTGTGRGSGLSVDLEEVVVFTFENGKITEGRGLPGPRKRPRSRRPVGVGDLGGERGGSGAGATPPGGARGASSQEPAGDLPPETNAMH